MAGYHIQKITKGELGEFSKVREEFYEFVDAHEQGSTIMELIELSDLVGATESYCKNHGLAEHWGNFHINQLTQEKNALPIHYLNLIQLFNEIDEKKPDFEKIVFFISKLTNYVGRFNMSYYDLYVMKNITERAFISGGRKP